MCAHSRLLRERVPLSATRLKEGVGYVWVHPGTAPGAPNSFGLGLSCRGIARRHQV